MSPAGATPPLPSTAFSHSPSLAWAPRRTAWTPPSFCRSAPRRRSSVSLAALFVDGQVHHSAAAGYSAPEAALPSFVDALSTYPDSADLLSSGGQLGSDVAFWLASTATDADLDAPYNSELSNILSSSSFAVAASPERAPSKEEVDTLQKAFAAFYGAERNVPEAYSLLSECIKNWEATKQGGDEIAGLYRVRGDVNMELFQPKDAEADYSKSIDYLQGPDGNKADPEELPASYLGRARAVRSMGSSATQARASQAAKDYEIYLNSISRLDDDEGDAKNSGDFSEAVVDGMQRNPYAAWEWGMVERVAGNYDRAAEVHRLAANAFDEIGDKPRSVISALDRGIDLASGLEGGSKDDTKRLAKAKEILEVAIPSDVNVEGRDVELLQRVVAKEGEARLALSGILWDVNQKGAAESQYGTACTRLDQLDEDNRAREAERIKKGRMPPIKPKGASLGFSIDDIVGADEASCSRFKNDKFVEEKVVWSEGLRGKVKKFLALGR